MGERSTTYYLDGLCCAEEERLIGKALRSIPGVRTVACNVVSHTTVITHTCAEETLLRALRQTGFSPRLHRRTDDGEADRGRRAHLLFTAASALLFLAGLLLGHASPLSLPLVVAAMIVGGWRVALQAWRALRHGSLDMNVLMSAATVGAAVIGRWDEGAAVILLYALSQLLERYSLDRARRAIRSLLALSPPLAALLRDGRELSVPIGEVRPGEHVVVRPGERLPLDGIVTAGESSVNQSPITGESLPVLKKPGDSVYAGSVNERGLLEIEVTRSADESTLAHIIRLVESAQTERAPIEQAAERFARYYTPAVLALALLLAVAAPVLLGQPFGTWFYRSLVMLVIACPCALVISTPVTILSGLSHAARQGILLKGGRYLEEIGRVTAVAFDKTGTLTEGRPRVTDIFPVAPLSEETILRLTALVELGSEHHLAGGVVRKARDEKMLLDVVRTHSFEAIAGRGVSATIEGVPYIVGNHALIEERGICTPEVEKLLEQLEGEGKTAIILGTPKEVLGVIALADRPRAESASVVSALRALGIQKVVMISGDNEGTARSVARRFGIEEMHANVLPGEKAGHVQRLRETSGRVAMVGDGINDAPALAAANVGIAMGASGTDITVETADVVLMADDLTKIPYLISLGRRTRSIIKQNIAIALATKLVFLGLGVAGIASLWLAVLADDGATLLVVMNGLRLLGRLRERGDAVSGG